MKHLEVLVVTEKTTHPKVLNWKVSTVNTIETTIEKLQNRTYQVIAIADTFNDEERLKLSQILSILYDDAILITYKDDAHLSEKVKTAYWRNNKPNNARNYLDNSFEMTLANRINNN